MTPTLDDLEARDLRAAAEAIARAHHVRLGDMLGDNRHAPRHVAAARGAFYAHLAGLGWSAYAIARYVGRHHTTVQYHLDRRARGLAPDQAGGQHG